MFRKVVWLGGGLGLVALSVWLAIVWLRQPVPAAGPIELRNVTLHTGITFVHTDGSSGRRYIVEPMSAGVATFDYDLDGRIDIYFPNGAPLPGSQFDRPPHHALYRNAGDWRFTDVTAQAGVANLGYGLGIAVSDYDHDGFPDLYLNNFGANVLYRNNGDGTFSDVTQAAGVANGDLVGAGACFLDRDGDGDLDLYVGNYLKYDFSMNVIRTQRGHPTYPSPRDYAPVPSTLFRNNGDGSFTDVSQESGIANHLGRAMGMVCADFDGDGDTDLFVANDVDANFCFVNDGTGKFEEAGVVNGLAYNAFGDTNAGMGVDVADYDQDGLLDFYLTSYQTQMPVLYRNLGNGLFQDVTVMTGAGEGTFNLVKWGTGLIDFNNDGFCDIFIVNGHTEDNIESREADGCYRCRNSLLLNTGDGRFLNISDRAGDGLRAVHAGRGAAFDDLDNDGRIDAVILNSREAPTLLRNVSGGANHWLQLQLRGLTSNRDGVGTQVRLMAGDLRLIDEVHSGRGYQSHFGARLHFGLGPHTKIDRIEVRWLGGGTDVFTNVAVDQRVTIVEGASPGSTDTTNNELQ